jgi:hypothetical protein
MLCGSSEDLQGETHALIRAPAGGYARPFVFRLHLLRLPQKAGPKGGANSRSTTAHGRTEFRSPEIVVPVADWVALPPIGSSVVDDS